MQATRSFSFDAIGTSWNLDIEQPISAQKLAALRREVLQRTEQYDRTYSRFRDDSLVSAIAQKAGEYEFPEDAGALFDLYEQLYRATDGAVSPLVGDLLVDAGYDAAYSFRASSEVKSVPRWQDVLSYKHPVLRTTQPVTLDFGAAGKGYLVDLVGQLLEAHDICCYTIDAGGDILRRNDTSPTIQIGLEHPGDPSMAIGILELGSGSVCGSASNRRRWGDLHHIMNPHTKQPVRDIIATWVTADSAMLADGLATALFLTEPATLKHRFTFEYCLIRSDMGCEYSSGLRAELFTGASA